MNITFTVSFSGTPDQEDFRAARQTVFMENQRLAALTPPGIPLPTSTPAEVKASYSGLLQAVVTAAHTRNILISKTQAISTRLTDAELKQLYSGVIDLLDSGATVPSILAKIV